MQTAMRKSTTPPASGSPEASSKTKTASSRPNLLTAEEMEQIDLDLYSEESWKTRRAETLARKARRAKKAK